ncbi:MAG: NifB/NifX family molybdenum-iron cluster-binding protein [Candidatus Zixiibacteriota bacterium]
MRIAIPTANGQLCPHFGHCQQFAIIDVNIDTKEIIKTEMLTPPPHEPGVLPGWLGQQGCQIIIAGGMGQRAISMFNQNGIQVVIGAPSSDPGAIVTDFLNDRLQVGSNMCDSSSHHGHGGGSCQ